MAWLNLGRTWLIGVAFVVGLPALAGIDDALIDDGWSEVLFDDKTPNSFASFEEGGVAVSSESSVSLVQRPVSIDLQSSPVLSWRWRVTEAAPPTDLSVKGGDDRSLALYVAFPFIPEEASVMERMKRAVIETTVGKEAPGRVLVYVWGGEGKRGDHVPSPYLGDAGMMTILRPADTLSGTWFSENIDIAEDYRNAFGSEPPNPISLAIGADTDDTMTTARGLITDLTFTDRSKAF